MAPTLFSNVVTLKMSITELVMEFGTHFPAGPGVSLPNDYQPDTRIALPIALLDGLVEKLVDAQRGRAGRMAEPTIQSKEKV
jgi:hypothetical protein